MHWHKQCLIIGAWQILYYFSESLFFGFALFPLLFLCRLKQFVNLSCRGSPDDSAYCWIFLAPNALERSVGFHYNRKKGCDWFIVSSQKKISTYNYSLLTIKYYWNSKLNNILFCKVWKRNDSFSECDFSLWLQQDLSLGALQKCKRYSDMLLQVCHVFCHERESKCTMPLHYVLAYVCYVNKYVNVINYFNIF